MDKFANDMAKIATDVANSFARCAFCGILVRKSKDRFFIKSEQTNTYICDECVHGCVENLPESHKPAAPTVQGTSKDG
jgi:hypothetical protein